MGLISRKTWSCDLRTIACTLCTVGAGLERCIMEFVNPFEDAEGSLVTLDHLVFLPIMDRLKQALVVREFKPDVIDTLEEGGLLRLLEMAWRIMVKLHEERKKVCEMALNGEIHYDEKTEELKVKLLHDEPVHFWEIPLPVVSNWDEIMDTIHRYTLELYELYLICASQLDFSPSRRTLDDARSWGDYITLHIDYAKGIHVNSEFTCSNFLDDLCLSVIPPLCNTSWFSRVFPASHIIFVMINGRGPGRDAGVMRVYIPNPKGAALEVIRLRESLSENEQARLMSTLDPLELLLRSWVEKINSTDQGEIAEMLENVSNDAHDLLMAELSFMLKPA
jgi:hypothetical protein